MAYKAEVTGKFHEDVDSALAYIETNLCSPQAASRLMGKIDDAMQPLSEMPLIRALSGRGRLAERGIRVHFVENYALAYLVQGESVIFVRFFHQSQLYEAEGDWPQQDDSPI